MRIFRKIDFRNKRSYQVAGALLVLLCTLVGLICVQYYRHIKSTVRQETGSYMQEIAGQMGSNIKKTIYDNFALLYTMEAAFDVFGVDDYAQIRTVTEEYGRYWNYQQLLLIDEKGIAHNCEGKTVALGGTRNVQDVVVARTHALSTAQAIDGKECIVFTVPIDNLTVEGTRMVALAGCYELATFDVLLHMTAFDGKGYAHIVLNDGTIVIQSSAPNALPMGHNILNFLLEARLTPGMDVADIQRDLETGKSGRTEFSVDGEQAYMTYTPLEDLGWNLVTVVPEDVANNKTTSLMNITLSLCCFVVVIFSVLFMAMLGLTYHGRRRLERAAYIDSVTGGNTIVRFYEQAQHLLEKANDKTMYAMIYMNIEQFKVLNEQFGKKACDEILQSIQQGIAPDLTADECMGRLFADNFCILAHYESEHAMTVRFLRWKRAAVAYINGIGSEWVPQSAEFGVFVIDDKKLPLAYMIDRAKLSLTANTCVMREKMRYAIYDERLRCALLRKKLLEDRMEDALERREFEVYLQPKYDTQQENIRGAEALVRWNSEAEGMIYPDEFIPLFEKNGFVVQVDLYVFEEVCRTLERWHKAGRAPLRISVNCSRIHLKAAGFLEKYRNIAAKYELPPNVLEIELTESAVFEDVEYLAKVIDDIHALGFACSMDDFGSGYSSLNLIRDIPVDALKLDKIFFRTAAKNPARTESVVGSIITMAKALHMRTVAEGVEEREQVEMLKRLRCDYVQGFYFARPMPIDAFERLAFETKP